MSALSKWTVAALIFVLLGSPSIDIELQNNSVREQQTRSQLEGILKKYDLSSWTFTRKVIIAERVIPHSHPVLTLNTRHLDSDDQLLSTYVHEQLHWWLDEHAEATAKAENELRKLYPSVPASPPEGASDEESTYLHLIDCYLEMQADRALLGPKKTDELMKFWAGDHYKWVYRTIVADQQKIGKIVKENGLEVENHKE